MESYGTRQAGGVTARAMLSILCLAAIMAIGRATEANDHFACGPGNGDCFSANGTPGCEDGQCCRAVCACDPFCCSNNWDEFCAANGFNGNGCGALAICDLPPAACCVNGNCQTLDEEGCLEIGGIYQGVNTTCAQTVCGAPPANDDCEDAIELLCGDSVIVDNSGATSEGLEVDVSCRTGQPELLVGSVWYFIVGTGNTIQIDTCATTDVDVDSVVVVYSKGAPGTEPDCSIVGVEAACNDNAPCGSANQRLSRVCFDSIDGALYMIGVGSFSEADRGTIRVSVTCPCPVGACCLQDGECTVTDETNCSDVLGGQYQGDGTSCATADCPIVPDECAEAQLLLCGESVNVDQELATSNASDPSFSCRFPFPADGFNTVWFKFVATHSTAYLSTCASESTTDTLIAVYSGACGNLTEIACNDNADCGFTGLLSEVCASGLVVGQTYYVQVGVFSVSDAGLTTLTLSCPCPTGACCLNNGSCLTTNGTACDTLGGVFLGNGSSCTGLQCPNCVSATCPGGPNVIVENEPGCGLPTDSVNGGCNFAPFRIQDVQCGTVFCGSGAFNGSSRDTDWFRITINEPSRVTMSLTADSTFLFGMISDAMGNPTTSCANFAAVFPFERAECGIVSECLEPGTYWFFAAPEFSAGVVGCPTSYVASWSCQAEACAAVCPAPGSCFAPHGTGGCEDGACCEAVCAIDSFCCESAWDDICSNTAFCVCEGGAGELPANDACEDAIAVTIGAPPVTGNTECASFDNPPAITCGTGGGITAPGVWYTVIGDGTQLTATTCNTTTDYDSKINIYCGDCSGLTCIAGNDDATDPTCGVDDQLARVRWCSVSGTKYSILVQGAGGATGTFALRVNSSGTACKGGIVCETGCAQDCVTSATLLPPPDGVVDGADLAVLLGSWGACPGCCADSVTSATLLPPPDGVVNGADLAVLLGAWGAPGCTF